MEKRIYAVKIDSIEKYYFFLGLEPTMDELDYEKDVRDRYFAFGTADYDYYIIGEESLPSLNLIEGVEVTMVDMAFVHEGMN